MKKIIFTIMAAALTTTASYGALLIDESFADLTGWTDSSGGNWTTGSGISDYTGWASTGGSAFENNASGSGTRLQNAAILGSNTIDDGTTYWGGILMNASSGFTAPRNLGFRAGAAGPYRLNIHIDASNNLVVGTRDSGADPTNGGNFTGSAVSLGTNTTNLLLFRIDAQAGNDNFYAWWNPNLGAGEPGVGTADFSSVGIDNFATTANMSAFDLDSSVSATVRFDELRLGTSFNEVIPEPSSVALLGLGVAGLLARRRR